MAFCICFVSEVCTFLHFVSGLHGGAQQELGKRAPGDIAVDCFCCFKSFFVQTFQYAVKCLHGGAWLELQQ
jgi:hypothetical protein